MPGAEHEGAGAAAAPAAEADAAAAEPLSARQQEEDEAARLQLKYADSCQKLEDSHLDDAIERALDESAPSTVLSPFLPSSDTDIVAFLDFAKISAQDLILDIGCGDGRVLVAAALLRGCRGIGVDISAPCIARAAAMAAAEGVGHLLSWHAQDLTTSTAAEAAQRTAASVVYLYVYPTLLVRLRPLAERLCAAGARVVTLQYHFEDWPAQDERGDPSLRMHTRAAAAAAAAAAVAGS